MKPPYIGVTGIVTLADVAAVAAAWAPLRRAHPTRRLLVGVLVSAKTLRGEATESRRYPAIGEVAGLLRAIAATGEYPAVHFNTRATGEAFRAELAALLALPLRALQLNVTRPDVGEVRRALDRHPHVEFVLQANDASRGNEPLLTYAARYRGVAHHALYDRSGGTGRGLDPGAGVAALASWDRWADLGVRPGLAGGLGPGCRATLAPFRGRAVSVDAESGLRVPVDDPTPGAKHQDRLGPDRVRAYLGDVVEVLG